MTFALLIALCGVASAHPQGQKPVALIRADGEVVQMLWVAARDDVEILAEHLGIPDVTPPALAAAESFRAYFQERVRVSAAGSACPGDLSSVERVASGFAMRLDFVCEEEVSEAAVRISLLHDLSTEYMTLAEAQTRGGPVRAALRFGAETLMVDFQAEATPRHAPALAEGEGRIARIISLLEGGIGPLSLTIALGLAFALGALHALTPGHGKTITAAYLVGEGGTLRQAFYLGGVVTVTHAVSVGLLGALAIGFDQILLPQQWGPWLEIAAGAMILGMGALLLRPGARPHHHHHLTGHGGQHGHSHDHLPAPMPLARLAVLGLIGGLIPSPEAIGIVLVAFSLKQWIAGLLLVAAFSLGLAAVVLGVALAAVRSGRAIRRLAEGRLARAAPRIAAVVFLAMGVVVVARGVTNL